MAGIGYAGGMPGNIGGNPGRGGNIIGGTIGGKPSKQQEMIMDVDEKSDAYFSFLLYPFHRQQYPCTNSNSLLIRI